MRSVGATWEPCSSATLVLDGELLYVVRSSRTLGLFPQEGQTTKRPKSSRLRALHCLVAGGCYDTVCDLPVPLRLPVAGQVAA
jgi:hypothetical protein